MDSENFFVTMDSQEDVTVEELSGEHEVQENREVVEAGENVIQVTDGEADEMEAGEGDTSSEDETEPLVTLTRKKKDPSPVWECGAIRIEGGTKCTLCGKEFICGGHNTSNIIRHILTVHKKQKEGKKLAEMIKSKTKRVAEKKKAKKAKVVEKQKVRQSSMKNFVKKVYIDPLKKKKVDESIVKLILSENQPLQLVEKHSFRELLYTLEPGYICPSRQTLTRRVEEFSEKTLVELKKEIEKDLKDVEDKVISVTSDHGTSLDRFRTHKNAVTISRCTKNFGIKTDTVGLIKCEGSQTGKTIRGDVRDILNKVGRKPDWIINWTTDGEAKQVNARGRGKHPEVGMDTHLTGAFYAFSKSQFLISRPTGFFRGCSEPALEIRLIFAATCVDHTAHLCSEDSLENTACRDVRTAQLKAHQLVESIKDSSLKKESFHKVMVDAGEEPLAIIQGSSNR